jgi:hypothetical protein
MVSYEREIHRFVEGEPMRTFVTCLAVTGLIVTVVGFTYGEGWMILVGIAALVAVLVMIGQGAVRLRDR